MTTLIVRALSKKKPASEASYEIIMLCAFVASHLTSLRLSLFPSTKWLLKSLIVLKAEASSCSFCVLVLNFVNIIKYFTSLFPEEDERVPFEKRSYGNFIMALL